MDVKKYKLTKVVRENIKSHAALLPPAPQLDAEGEPTFETINKRIKGKNLPSKIELNGEILPDKYYTVRETKMVMLNHEHEMQKYYKSHGQPGIDEYCKVIRNGVMYIESLNPNKHNLKIIN